MKHDPLLKKPWNPPAIDDAIEAPAPSIRFNSSSTNRREIPESLTRAKRVKHPAVSSRILATGFSIAAVIGVSTAYAKAQKQEELQKLIDAQLASTNSPEQSAGVQAQSSPTQLPPAVTPNSTPTVQSPASSVVPETPVVTSPNIVQVPVAPAQPAQPAYTLPAQDRGSQPSGGSQ